jgi:hypothetical protein
MKHPMNLTPVLVFALLLSACATEEKQTPAWAATPGVQTEERASLNAHGDSAKTVTISKITATVEAIDLATRLVILVGPQGNTFILQAGKQVRNLDQVKAGDKVTVEYHEGLVAEIAHAGAALNEVKVTDTQVRAPRGQRPEGAVGEAISATVVIEDVDTVRNVVHFKGPLGKTRIVKVMQPEFRAMLKNLKPGDQVTLTFFEALAVSVQPAGN